MYFNTGKTTDILHLWTNIKLSEIQEEIISYIVYLHIGNK